MQVTLEPYRVEHGLEVMGALGESCRSLLAKYATAGPAFTGRLSDGRILACAGLMIQVPWVADGWMLPTALVKTYPMAFHKTVRDAFGQLVHGLQIARVQVAVNPSVARHCAWIERMGFIREGAMRKFGPHGETMDLYAIFPGE